MSITLRYVRPTTRAARFPGHCTVFLPLKPASFFPFPLSTPPLHSYFPLRALAEPTKITLEYGNVPYTEEVVQFADWGGSKKKDPSFTVFGQVGVTVFTARWDVPC
jgi:hypothetical protein